MPKGRSTTNTIIREDLLSSSLVAHTGSNMYVPCCSSRNCTALPNTFFVTNLYTLLSSSLVWIYLHIVQPFGMRGRILPKIAPWCSRVTS